MVDSLRAALRFLPAVRPSIGGTSCGACSRVSKARIHSASEQSALLALKVHPQIINCEKVQSGGPGIIRFARAVFAYVGAGLSAVTANQLAGPSILQAKELGSSLGGNHTTVATETLEMWQRTSANRHIVHEDAIRSPKFAHCPLPHIVSKSPVDACHGGGHSYCWNNCWGPVDGRFSADTKLDPQWQFSPSTNRDYRSKLGGPDESLNNRFSKPAGLQALATESCFSMKSRAGLMSTSSDYNTSAELELEWQLIVDPKPKAGFGSEENDEVTFADGVGSNTEQNELENVQLVTSSAVGTSQIMTKSSNKIVTKCGKDVMTKCSKEIMTNEKKGLMTKSNKETIEPFESPSGDGIDKDQFLISKQGVVFQEVSDHQEQGSGSSMKKSLLWRAGGKEALATLVAEKTTEAGDICDTATQPTRSMSRMSLSSFDINTSTVKQEDMFHSFDKNLLAAILQGNEPTQLESSCLPSSALYLGSLDQTVAEPVHFQRVSEPLTIPTAEARPTTRRGLETFSADSRNTKWNGGGTRSTSANHGSGLLLGEALCHSQTRAREAEKKVQQVYEEKERLVHLFFREASRSLTYQQWATSLQVENMWLRKFAPNESLAWLHRSFVNPFSEVESMSVRGWKDMGENYARRQMQHNVSDMHEKDAVDLRRSDSNDIMMGCTLGIAFALGLSLAGAGLMIGWSMGWILLAYSVSV